MNRASRSPARATLPRVQDESPADDGAGSRISRGPGGSTSVAPRGSARRQDVLMRWPYLPFNLMVLSGALAAAVLPPLVAVIVLRDSLAGILVLPVLAWWMGTALISAVGAVHGQDLLSDAHLLRRMAQGLREAAHDAAPLWLPPGVAALGIAGSAATTSSTPWIPILLGGVLVFTALIGSAIAGCFTFRARDLWRLSIAFIALRPVAALGVACLLLLTVACVAAAGDGIVLLIAGLFAVLLERTATPILDHVRSHLVV